MMTFCYVDWMMSNIKIAKAIKRSRAAILKSLIAQCVESWSFVSGNIYLESNLFFISAGY